MEDPTFYFSEGPKGKGGEGAPLIKEGPTLITPMKVPYILPLYELRVWLAYWEDVGKASQVEGKGGARSDI